MPRKTQKNDLENKVLKVPTRYTDGMKFRLSLTIYDSSNDAIEEFDEARKSLNNIIPNIRPLAYIRRTREIIYELNGKILRNFFDVRFTYDQTLSLDHSSSMHGYVALQKPTIPKELKDKFKTAEIKYH